MGKDQLNLTLLYRHSQLAIVDPCYYPTVNKHHLFWLVYLTWVNCALLFFFLGIQSSLYGLSHCILSVGYCFFFLRIYLKGAGRGPFSWFVPWNHVFFKYFHFAKKLQIFYCSFSNLGPGMVQLKYQRAKRLKFSFSVLQMLKVNQEWVIFYSRWKITNF